MIHGSFKLIFVILWYARK